MQLSTVLERNALQCDSQSSKQFGLGNLSPVHLRKHLALQKNALSGLPFNWACVKLNRIMTMSITPIVFISIFPMTLLRILSKDLNIVQKIKSHL